MPFAAGQIVYESDFVGLQPDYTYKGAATTRNNTAALANDPDLQNIHLDPGYYAIRVLLVVSVANITPKIKVAWAFTGSWTTPIKGAIGPGTANTGVPDTVNAVNMIAQSGTQTYTPAVSGANVTIAEWCDRVEILSSGDFSIQWAQNTATAANTTVQPGSSVLITKVT